MSVKKEHQFPYRVVMSATNTGRMNVLLRWWQSAVQNWQRRKMIAALEALDDRTLMDIGVHRGGIKRVVDGTANGPHCARAEASGRVIR